MTTTANQFLAPDILTWEALQTAKFAFINSFQLPLLQGTFHSEKTLRILPRKRLIAFGTWEGKPVVAKIFFNHKRAKRHMETEIAGVNLLLDKGIPTPAVYYQGTSTDQRLYVVIFERLTKAKPFEEYWKTKTSIPAVLPKIEGMLKEFAHHHQLGILQHDPNLKNYMLSDDVVYMIDCADVEAKGAPVDKTTALKNLAIFFSQFGDEITPHLTGLLQYYAQCRDFALAGDEVKTLANLTAQHTAGRLQRLEKRIFSECRYFSRITHSGIKGMLDRRYAAPELMAFIKQPAFIHGDCLTKDNRELVFKRYRHNFVQTLLSLFKPTPASLEWKNNNIGHFMGNIIHKPIAYIERRRFGFSWESYYLAESETTFEII